MKELPSDILELIADISKREDVVRASSVCKAWRTSFAPYAFATLSFRNVDFRSRFEHPEALVSFDRIMPHVRELVLGEFGSTGTVRAPLIAAINTSAATDADADESAHPHRSALFTHLKCFHVYVTTYHSYGDFLNVLRSISLSFGELVLTAANFEGPLPTSNADQHPQTSTMALKASPPTTLVDTFRVVESAADNLLLKSISLPAFRRAFRIRRICLGLFRPHPKLVAVLLNGNRNSNSNNNNSVLDPDDRDDDPALSASFGALREFEFSFIGTYPWMLPRLRSSNRHLDVNRDAFIHNTILTHLTLDATRVWFANTSNSPLRFLSSCQLPALEVLKLVYASNKIERMDDDSDDSDFERDNDEDDDDDENDNGDEKDDEGPRIGSKLKWSDSVQTVSPDRFPRLKSVELETHGIHKSESESEPGYESPIEALISDSNHSACTFRVPSAFLPACQERGILTPRCYGHPDIGEFISSIVIPRVIPPGV